MDLFIYLSRNKLTTCSTIHKYKIVAKEISAARTMFKEISWTKLTPIFSTLCPFL